MRAVVFDAPNEVAYRELPEPTVAAGEVLVRSREAGLCRTDIEMMTGVFTDPRWVRFPLIPGHEWAGTVVDVGAIGVGTLGALAISLLALHSPSRIVAFGVRDEELELAQRLGATDILLAGDGTSESEELDLVVETAGAAVAVELATQLCRPG